MPASSEIRSVIITTAKPSGPGDLGQVEEGFYTRDGELITMCDRDGVPLRDENTGRRIAMRLLPGDDEKTLARKMTLRRYREANRDQMAGFHRTIRYGKSNY
jgi:hypothetical protein